MFKWLFRIALGFVALKLAETYQRASPATKEKPLPDKPATGSKEGVREITARRPLPAGTRRASACHHSMKV